MTPGSRADAAEYRVDSRDVATYHADGYVLLRGVFTSAEMDGLETVYERFMRREIAVPGKDFCDMSGDYDRRPEDFAIVNVMLPRRYYPAWQGNVYERRAAQIAAQIVGPNLELDYDQLLAKGPYREDAVFHWHQDLAYWIDTPDTRTASFWLAIDDATVENGCLRFVPGSHREPRLRPHRPLAGGRDKSHTLVADFDPARDTVRHAELKRGDLSVHHERVVHGSGPNRTASRRRAYVVAFRDRATIAEERRRGFTHSHNDAADVLGSVGKPGESR